MRFPYADLPQSEMGRYAETISLSHQNVYLGPANAPPVVTSRSGIATSAVGFPEWEAAARLIVKDGIGHRLARRNTRAGILGRDLVHILRLDGRLVFRYIHSGRLTGQQGQADQQGQGQRGEFFRYGIILSF